MSDLINKAELPTSIDTGQLQLSGIWETHYGTLTAEEARLFGDTEVNGRYALDLAALNTARQTLIDENEFYDTKHVPLRIRGAFDYRDIAVMRGQGLILAVSDHGRPLFPDFQFDPKTTIPSPLIQTVHRALALTEETPLDGWTELSYWSTPQPSLGGRAFKNILWNPADRGAIIKDLKMRLPTGVRL